MKSTNLAARIDTIWLHLEAGLSRCKSWDGFRQAQYLETRFLLPGYILSSQRDRVAMAHSIEGRFSFWDHRVVEFAARLPPHLKMKVLNEKYLLKRAAGDLVPPAVKKRTKQPYRAPDASTFFDGNSRKTGHEHVERLLSPKRIREIGIFNPPPVTKLIEKARNGHTLRQDGPVSLRQKLWNSGHCLGKCRGPHNRTSGTRVQRH